MGVNVIDASVLSAACADDPTEVTITILAERQRPSFNESQVITQGEHGTLLDAATSFATFDAKAQMVIPTLWDTLPNSAPDNLAKMALYQVYKAQRAAAVAYLCPR